MAEKYTEQQLKDFDEATEHPYECKCEKCKLWWEMMPPEDGEGEDDESDDLGEPIGSCEMCQVNIYEDDIDGLCDQCAWHAGQAKK